MFGREDTGGGGKIVTNMFVSFHDIYRTRNYINKLIGI